MRDGDLIVTDMYLPEWAIKRILRNCGLKKDVTIYVETGGKSSGTIWKRLPPISRHIGDNRYSDVKTAKANGIRATLFTGSQFTDLERLIGGDLALLMRIVRLANPYQPGSTLHYMWLEQAQLNIPAPVLAALEIPAEGVAFVMRDCVHLQPIHEALHGTKNTTFHCSRIALRQNLPAFQEHLKEATTGRTIVGIHGTGVNMIAYWQKHFNAMPGLIYVSGVLEDGKLLAPTTHDSLERFNSSPLGSIDDYPNRKECEFDKDVVKCQADAVSCALSHIPYFSFAPNLKQLKLLIDKMKVSVTCRKNVHIANH